MKLRKQEEPPKLRKGGMATHTKGYVLTYVPDHPYAWQNGYLPRCRMVMEEHLRATQPDSPALVDVNGVKYLRRDWDVHHLNQDKTDDRLENLQTLQHDEHAVESTNYLVRDDKGKIEFRLEEE